MAEAWRPFQVYPATDSPPTMNSTDAPDTGGLATFALTPTNILAAFFVGLLIVLTLVGNGIVFASFYTFRDLRTICNYFIISLAAADVLVALLAMPFWLLLQLTPELASQRILSEQLLMFWYCMDILGGTASIVNLAAVSADRNVAITAPYRYPHVMTSSRALVILCFVWAYSVVVSALRLADWGEDGYQYFVFVASFSLPLLFMIVMYVRIYVTARRQARLIGRRRSRSYTTDVKAAKTIAVVIGVFIVCWLPFFVSVLGYLFNPHFYPLPMFKVVKWLEYLNSSLNPIIYTCLNKTYRRAFRRLFARWRGNLARTRQDSISTLSRRLTFRRGSMFPSQNSHSASGSDHSSGELRRKGSKRGRTEKSPPITKI